jgi:hypothetical protein
MINITIEIIIMTIVFLLTPAIVFADPVVLDPVHSIGALCSLFFAEALVLIFLLWRRPLHRIRFFIAWTLVTTITWIIFYFSGLFLVKMFSSIGLEGFFLGELAVVFIEAKILMALLRWRVNWQWVVVKESVSISFIGAIFYSLAANMTSLGLSYILMATARLY